LARWYRMISRATKETRPGRGKLGNTQHSNGESLWGASGHQRKTTQHEGGEKKREEVKGDMKHIRARGGVLRNSNGRNATAMISDRKKAACAKQERMGKTLELKMVGLKNAPSDVNSDGKKVVRAREEQPLGGLTKTVPFVRTEGGGIKIGCLEMTVMQGGGRED